jgi:hypothetical protein
MAKKTLRVTLAILDRLQASLERARDEYLRDSGWDERNDIPGAKWMWVRTLPDGRVVWCDRDLALIVQGALEADPC